MNYPKLYIGPMSKNIVDAAIEFSNDNKLCVGFCVSRRQVEFDGGYVNGWTTESFTDYVRAKTLYSTLVRDHGGPGQGSLDDDGFESFSHDVKSFNIIHIDPWKVFKSVDEEIDKTVEYIKFCDQINSNCFYEVGTEQSICAISSEDLYKFLMGVHTQLGSALFCKILYAVIQSGTSLKEDINTGNYDVDKLTRMVEVCDKFGILPKEHNGDYLNSNLIREKFSLGLEAINIAPEFGVIETLCVLDRIGSNNDLLDTLHLLCVESGKWKKWVDDDFDPFDNKKQLIKICGHYMFSTDSFKEILKDNIFDGLAAEVKLKVQLRIKDIIGQDK